MDGMKCLFSLISFHWYDMFYHCVLFWLWLWSRLGWLEVGIVDMVVDHLAHHEENGANHHDGGHPRRMQVVCGHLEVLSYQAKGFKLTKQLSIFSIETDVESVTLLHICPVNCYPGQALNNCSNASNHLQRVACVQCHTWRFWIILSFIYGTIDGWRFSHNFWRIYFGDFPRRNTWCKWCLLT